MSTLLNTDDIIAAGSGRGCRYAGACSTAQHQGCIPSVIRRLLRLSLFFLFCAGLINGCGILSLEPVGIRTFPEKNGQILQPDQPLWISFSTAPEETSAEKLIQIHGGPEEIQLDFIWDGKTVSFTPAPEFKPGVRYILCCSGTLETLDGRASQINKKLAFFYASAAEPPKLLCINPTDGGDCGCSEPLTFQFDKPIQEEKFRHAFMLSPVTDYALECSDSGCAQVFPENGWTPRTLYTWELAESCSGTGGVPLQCTYRGSFRVQADAEPPSLNGWGPVRLIGDVYMQQHSFQKGDCLQLKFSEPVDIETLERAFSLSPSIRGEWAATGSGSYVFSPGEPFTMNVTYRMTLSRELADPAGNCLQKAVTRFFTPDIPVQQVTEIRCIGRETVTITAEKLHPPPAGPAVLSFAGPGPEYTQLIEIDFSRPYGEPRNTVISGAINLHGFFPVSISNPGLEQAVWTNGGYTIRFFYSGFIKSPPMGNPEKTYYKLTIPGGEEISSNEEGSFLESDVVVVLEAERIN